MIRAFTIFLLGILMAITAVVSLPQIVSATEKQYYWDGNETIIVKHPYFKNTEECKTLQKAGKPCNESAVFELDRNTRDKFIFYARQIDTIKANGVDRCVFKGYKIEISFQPNGQAISDGVQVPFNKDSTTGEDWADVNGGQISNLGANNNACQKSF